MKYSIVIPTYNHCDDLLVPCIESIKKYTDLSDIEILIVANGCKDNTKQYVESLGYPFKLLWHEEPLGYTIANNIGLKAAKGEYILMLNNDIEILPCEKNSWLNALTEPFLNNKRMGLTGSLMLHDHDIKRDFIVFCCAMIKRSILYEIGFPDEIFSPGYGEDIDYTLRVARNGYQWKCVDVTRPIDGMHVGTFPIWHKGTKTFGEIPSYGLVTVEKNRKLLIDRYVNNNNKLKMKYSVIIPTYNHCDDLLKPCLESIFKFTNMAEVELIISANGCFDNTKEYLNQLRQKFDDIGLGDNLKIIWHDKALGYSKACNVAIKQATADLIVLLNNDTVLLGQEKSSWLKILQNPFAINNKCGVSCIIKGPSEPAGHDFAIFFCVMIHRKVFDKIGLLNEAYGVGGGEDTEFSIEAERAGFEVCQAIDIRWSTESGMFTGTFPIYHKGEGTVHDASLVNNWNDIFLQNSLRLAKKYNVEWYKRKINNNYERAIFVRGEPLLVCEHTRYTWVKNNILGTKILEIGCSNGYGTQYMPENADYTGLDYDPLIVWCANNEGWGDNFKFINADINTYNLEYYDTIIAFEVIEHLDNGLEIVEKLKNHCNRLLITVPHMEPKGFWGQHHKLHMLNESYFQGFKYNYIDSHGNITDTLRPVNESNRYNLLIMSWTK